MSLDFLAKLKNIIELQRKCFFKMNSSVKGKNNDFKEIKME